jgi:hypothetical protein
LRKTTQMSMPRGLCATRTPARPKNKNRFFPSQSDLTPLTVLIAISISKIRSLYNNPTQPNPTQPPRGQHEKDMPCDSTIQGMNKTRLNAIQTGSTDFERAVEYYRNNKLEQEKWTIDEAEQSSRGTMIRLYCEKKSSSHGLEVRLDGHAKLDTLKS